MPVLRRRWAGGSARLRLHDSGARRPAADGIRIENGLRRPADQYVARRRPVARALICSRMSSRPRLTRARSTRSFAGARDERGTLPPAGVPGEAGSPARSLLRITPMRIR
jgi:hypothetical protein